MSSLAKFGVNVKDQGVKSSIKVLLTRLEELSALTSHIADYLLSDASMTSMTKLETELRCTSRC